MPPHGVVDVVGDAPGPMSVSVRRSTAARYLHSQLDRSPVFDPAGGRAPSGRTAPAERTSRAMESGQHRDGMSAVNG